MQRYTVYFIWKLLYIFRVVPPSIIRSADNCIYNIWYLSYRYCYLPLQVAVFPAILHDCRSQWQHGLRRRSAAPRLLRSWVRIPPRAWMFVVSVVCCQVEVSATS